MGEWRTIDTAPKSGRRVIVGRGGTASQEAKWVAGESEGWYSSDSAESGYNQWRAWPPTHWMPLPSPPSDSGSDPEGEDPERD